MYLDQNGKTCKMVYVRSNYASDEIQEKSLFALNQNYYFVH